MSITRNVEIGYKLNSVRNHCSS